ncbi:periplasmic binding protein-like I [Zychaea mexicana]|uniref:periplasmic binding protein-like I n=1 Tax=Zychaea mexicana TaxID=64656 RepID=UPI0022FEF0C3|nr:periplasmic binding protein-like I [Zychaea mexicana]KAI9496049.1 periplasmic binding protein-like I [Zychaea mexicana]
MMDHHQAVDDADTDVTNFGSVSYFQDQVNSYEFSVTRYNGSTYVSPRFKQKQRVELKIGILLPFHQKNDNYTRELTLSGTSAIRMAAAEINVQELIPGAYITLVEKDSFPKDVEGQGAITQAVVAAVSLVQEGVIGVIGDISSSWTSLSALITSTLQIPQCSYTAVAASLADRSQYGHFFRTVQTPFLFADAALSFVTSRGWPSVGMLYSNDEFGKQLSQYTIMKAKNQGVHMQSYQSFYDDTASISQVAKDIDAFLSTGVRIVLIAAQGDAQLTALAVAAHRGYMDENHVWIVLAPVQDLQESIASFNAILVRRSQGEQLNEANHVGMQDVSQETLDSNQTAQSWVTPLDYLAWTTSDTQSISYQTAFSGGIFSFRSSKDLSGYQPFDDFLEKWSHLDPTLYPFAGIPQVSPHVGMAYSCMMTMARGFTQSLLHTSQNNTAALHNLTSGDLGETLVPTAFNTGYQGPEGPIVYNQDGDRTTGNFRVFNIQHGEDVQIGTIFAGELNLTSPPLYFNGGAMTPTGMPGKESINPGYHTAISLIIISFASFGVFVALVSACSVITYKRHQTNISTLKSSILELTGFLLLYISVFFFSADRARSDCFIIPISFHLGFDLVLCCLSIKLYHIYQVHNNIYISGPLLSDRRFLQICSGALLAPVIGLLIWLPTTSSSIQTINTPVSTNTYYTRCDYGSQHQVFVALISLIAALFLAVAVILALRTRGVPGRAPKYSEVKYINLAVYNIFFSTFIGFTVFRTATADYFTRHYLSAAMIVWGSTVSLLVLYLPKLHTIYIKDNPHARKSLGRLSNASQLRWGNQQQQQQQLQSNQGRSFTPAGEIVSINRMINNTSGPFVYNNGLSSSSSQSARQRVHQRHQLTTGSSIDAEAYECRMAVQVVYRYFAHLGAWDMKHIVLFPRIGYFSFVSEKSHKGLVFHYVEASIVSSMDGGYILKVHGTGQTDVLMQVARHEDLDIWYERFNVYSKLQQCQQAYFNTGSDLPPAQQVIGPFAGGGNGVHQNHTTATETTTMTSFLTSRDNSGHYQGSTRGRGLGYDDDNDSEDGQAGSKKSNKKNANENDNYDEETSELSWAAVDSYRQGHGASENNRSHSGSQHNPFRY